VATVAVPIFKSRIAPVFDSCIQVLVIEIEHKRELARSKLHIENLLAFERVATLKRAGVTTLICAGISNVLHTMLESAGIRVIPGIIGQIDEVITAYVSKRLDDQRFFMPGRVGRSTNDPE
jgi:predicted Fe-Mo cluster-binding NifX family protein